MSLKLIQKTAPAHPQRNIQWHQILRFRFQILLLGALFLYSCTTTRFFYEYGHPRTIHLTCNDVVLVSQLPGISTELYLERITEIFDKKGIKVKYEISEEWDLKLAGIESPFDSSEFRALGNMEYTHILQFQSIYAKAATKYASFTPLEVSQEDNPLTFNPTFENNGNQSRIRIDLSSLDELMEKYAVTVSVNISHTTFKHEDQGETHLNLSDKEMARKKAIINGIKQLLKDCYVR